INIENQHVLAALLKAPVGVPIFVRAWGKGPDARLEIVGVDENVVPQPQRGAAPTAPSHHGNGASRGADLPPITHEHWKLLRAAHAVLTKLTETYPEYAKASPDAKLEFIRAAATNYRMDLVHNPERPLTGPGVE